MSRKRNTPWRRMVAAHDVLRGRRPKTDYGLLIVLPMVASAGGALIGLGVDMAVTRRAAARQATAQSGRVSDPEPVTSSGRRDV